MLAAGFVVVAIGLVALWHNVTEASEPARVAAVAPVPPAPVIEAIEAPEASPVAPPVVHEVHPVAAAARARVTRPEQAPALAPSVFSFKRELKRDANGNLVPIISAGELRAQLAAIDPLMKACAEHGGAHVTGTATLNFTVDAKNNKLFVETTGVQDEETLAAYPDLLDCMHRTASSIPLVLDKRPIPELGTPIYVRRHVRIEDGALAENSIVNFSYNP
jgi:hypothetical protein